MDLSFTKKIIKKWFKKTIFLLMFMCKFNGGLIATWLSNDPLYMNKQVGFYSPVDKKL